MPISKKGRSEVNRLYVVLALFLGFLLLRLPVQSGYPVNWDAVQFALGIQHFDIQHHQPHPPGYIGYIALGKLVNLVVHDPHTSLTLIGAIAGAAAPAMFYPLARRFMTDRLALSATILFGTSMLVWYYSEVALTYVVELALLLPFLLLAHRAIVRLDRQDLLLASGILATVGAFRQTALVLMLLLWVYAAWQHSWRVRAQASGILVGGILLWFVPLLWLSGGPSAYLDASRDLAAITGGNTSILSLEPAGPAANAGWVLIGLVIGVNVGVLILIAGREAIIGWLSSSSRHERVFFALWALPALIVYLLGHTGQVGYILLLLPIPFLGLGIAIGHVAHVLHGMFPRLRPSLATLVLVAIFVTVNIAGFFALPPAVGRAAPESVPLDLRQFDVRGSDEHWRELTATIRRYPADNTVVLTTIGGPRVSGSFRHLSYLLPEYHVYGLGRSLESGAFGPLFYAHDGRSNYGIGAMHDADVRLELPREAQYIIIPDAEITERLQTGRGNTAAWTVQHGAPGGNPTVVIVEPETTLIFSIRGEIITFSDCGEERCALAPTRAG